MQMQFAIRYVISTNRIETDMQIQGHLVFSHVGSRNTAEREDLRRWNAASCVHGY